MIPEFVLFGSFFFGFVCNNQYSCSKYGHIFVMRAGYHERKMKYDWPFFNHQQYSKFTVLFFAEVPISLFPTQPPVQNTWELTQEEVLTII